MDFLGGRLPEARNVLLALVATEAVEATSLGVIDDVEPPPQLGAGALIGGGQHRADFGVQRLCPAFFVSCRGSAGRKPWQSFVQRCGLW